MIKSLILKLAKKYVVSALNDVLESKKTDVEKARAFIQVWLARLKVILSALEKALSCLDDNKLDDAEVEYIVSTVEKTLEGKAICDSCTPS